MKERYIKGEREERRRQTYDNKSDRKNMECY